jgi:hypothetical protein
MMPLITAVAVAAQVVISQQNQKQVVVDIKV